jgi:hypothetical protein
MMLVESWPHGPNLNVVSRQDKAQSFTTPMIDMYWVAV